MSILIRGMEMPKNCDECRFCVNGFTDDAPMYECAVQSYENVSVLVESGGKPFDFRPDWCPLTELPPHGRLGDLDKLEEQFKRAIETYIPKDPTRHMDVVTSNRCHAWCNGLTVIQDAPTVIEAEEKDE